MPDRRVGYLCRVYLTDDQEFLAVMFENGLPRIGERLVLHTKVGTLQRRVTEVVYVINENPNGDYWSQLANIRTEVEETRNG